MSTIISERLKRYAAKSQEEENHALKEILQEIVLAALSEAGFFKEALFQGGTSLRIFYGLERFSEDLNFILKQPKPRFNWQPFLSTIEEVCKRYGLAPEVIDKSKAGPIQKMFLKDTSIVKILNLTMRNDTNQKLVIKLEIDINPPAGSSSEIKFFDFPHAFDVEVQDLASNFAGKSHALLCRRYIKGRDWYDYLWYIARKVTPNFSFLSAALNQQGPWAGQNLAITPQWYLAALREKIATIDWQAAAHDVSPFLNAQDGKTLRLWQKDFFLDRTNQLGKYL